jgi:hypothetical protein
MTVQALNITPNNSTLAAFNAWGSAISAAIAAAGLAKTSDTGQINWTTNTTNLAGSSGYEVWAFTDSLQSVIPIYVRLDYGAGMLSAPSGFFTNPYIKATWGTATNGAGGISAGSGTPGASAYTAMFSNPNGGGSVWGGGTAPALFWVDSDGGSSLMLGGWFNYASSSIGAGVAANSGGLLVIERTRNWDGTPNGNGLTVFSTSTKNLADGPGSPPNPFVTMYMAVYPLAHASTFQTVGGGFGTTGIAPQPWVQGIIPAGTAAIGSTTYAWPIMTGYTPELNGPSKHLVAVQLGDFGAGASFSITHYGTAHTFQTTMSGGTMSGQGVAFRIS